MILQALYKLAEREQLMSDPDFQWKPVAWLVKVGEGGEFHGLTPTHYKPPATGKKKPKPVAKDMRIPIQPGRSGRKAPAQFFVDNAKYVFGMATKDKDIDPADGQEKAEDFRDRIKDCAKLTTDEAAQAVATFLENVAEGSEAIDLPEECKSNDQFAFIYAPDKDLLVHERTAIEKYWKEQRSQSEDNSGDSFRCLVTGDAVPESVLFPLIKKVPGGTSSGCGFVGFNRNAFESYGLKGNENAPVSRNAAEACSTALNRLLDPAFPDPNHPGEKLPSRNVRLSADTVVCFWSAMDDGQDFCNMFGALVEANPEEVRQTYRSIWYGKEPPDIAPADFYALTLTGTQGRAVVRDWFETTVQKAANNIAQYFSDLSLKRNCPPPKKTGHPPAFAMRTLLESIADPVKRRGEGVPGPLAAQMVHAALSGGPFPRTALIRAVNRYRMEIGNEYDEDGGWFAKNWNDHRAAIIKAALNRMLRLGQTQYFREEIQPTMNPCAQNDGYILGQLMAVFERLQQLALENPNASVVDRYFSGASAAPKSVFVRLYKNARHHARKARDNRKTSGQAFLLERLIDALSARFGVLSPTEPGYKLQLGQPHAITFPSHLNIEEQGTFVLGYHQMRHWLWMNNEDRQQWEKDHPDASKAFVWSKQKEEAEAVTGEKVED